MLIGILALQGAFIEHKEILDKLGIDSFEIRQKKDVLRNFDALILPGGESPVMGKLLRELDIYEELKNKIENGMPVFGTCAGMILLAKEIDNDDKRHLALMDITVKRNAYGRQLGSFKSFEKFGNISDFPMVFIRAPYVVNVGNDVEILSVVDEKIVASREKNMLVTAFHPELTKDTRIHEYFIEMVKENGRV
ncbi:pyridoxal 5'-phosphate synthase glutaminase subunit PdxT [Streptobacillus moniliformis]|uniref:Pyridoxal 5'-phosphate synthase subunit PdxT n=1 Tax=Streptobacillus moniliformis (strain ATCC 14647 / DSM 12112 / NCTC 10651 / 9901) TaxID=519441 RepID=D1AYP9_STRM9|nr:pyridoxal 5'-phosphate synthase glutaminase subunit PdxT [Streptobacillus moniliformis]ACZ01425.1 SNO glutamine amidotransferase [Streptobacillus moniliformis DSM 12112]AVL43566.1 pyridoxal 5'-phosphate synthase glutaminase subunit PdxT [Streptobacillus moniliformis]SQA13415.1 Glutamine amidotransferase subunit pdxT [Streptobacillus moniliformis]